MMNFNEYQDNCLRTMANDLSAKTALATWALGLSGESGEVADHIKKFLGQGHDLNKAKIAEELGDILFYIAAMASELGVSLQDVASNNVEKLRQRYPNGFEVDRSINR